MAPPDFSQVDPLKRPTVHGFRPPRNNRLVSRFGKAYAKRLIRRKLKVVEIEVEDDGMERLASLAGKRCLVLPSHSGGFEPYIIVRLSRLLDLDFNYLAAMETFERNPLIGWFMQRMGAYSIIRGTADRHSFVTTKKLLVEGKRWLVIFPEGQTVWQNDTVIPFQEGVAQLAFKACEEIAKGDAEESLLCLPMSIKYVYLGNMDREMDESLARLEAALFPAGFTPKERRYDRLRDISEALLAANEKRHGVKPDPDDSRDDRIQRMKERIVGAIERQLDVTPRADQDLLDRIRACFNVVDHITQESPPATDYDRKLLAERQQMARDLCGDLWRVLQFVAIYDGYVRELLTVERFMDVLCLLEMEVFAERRMWGPRKAVVKVGEALDLRDHFAAYKADKRAVIRKVSMALESSVRGMLEDLATRHSNPL